MATKSFDFADYFRSSFAEKLISNPDSIENHSTPATRLLEKKREMIELEQVGSYSPNTTPNTAQYHPQCTPNTTPIDHIPPNNNIVDMAQSNLGWE